MPSSILYLHRTSHGLLHYLHSHWPSSGGPLSFPHLCHHCVTNVDILCVHELCCLSTGCHFRPCYVAQGIAFCQCSHLTGLDHADGKCLVGIIIVPWSNGRLAYTFCPSHLQLSLCSKCAAAIQAEQTKIKKYTVTSPPMHAQFDHMHSIFAGGLLKVTFSVHTE